MGCINGRGYAEDMADPSAGGNESEVGIIKSNDPGRASLPPKSKKRSTMKIATSHMKAESYLERKPYPGTPLQNRAWLPAKFRPAIIEI